MRNLIGYFKNKECNLYSVKIIADPTSDAFTEIELGGSSPFVVTYDTSDTPFEPVRYSRASITAVASEYFLDAYSPYPHGTKVILTDEENEIIEWTGYLTSNLLNMPFSSCQETFTMEAQDCLCTLEKYDYETIGEHKAVVSFKDIMAEIANRCENIEQFYVQLSKKGSDNQYATLDKLQISEQNFFSSDTDEPWKLSEVLEEICRYLGYTAFIYREHLYIVDYQAIASRNNPNSAMRYAKYNNFSTGTSASFPQMSKIVQLFDSTHFRGDRNDVSLETVYNKMTVKDSFYEIDHFIPDIYKEDDLTNRQGEFYKCRMVPTGIGKLKYISKSGFSKNEEEPEENHKYYNRRLDNKYYNSVYRDPNTLSAVTVTAIDLEITNCTADTIEIQDTIRHRIGAKFTNNSDEIITLNIVVEGEVRWYDEHSGTEAETGYETTALTIAAGTTAILNGFGCEVGISAAPQGASFSSNFFAYFTVNGSTARYSIVNGLVREDISRYVGCTIEDLATFEKQLPDKRYNYETVASLSFDRYLMIMQKDKPDGYLLPEDYNLSPTQIDTKWPSVLNLVSGYTNPFIVDSNAFLAINASAIYERYAKEYFSPDWSNECTGINGLIGCLSPVDGVTTAAPHLILKLGIGNMFWNGTSWTNENGCFYIKLGTDYKDDKNKADYGETDFREWWNKEHMVLNNVDWTEWAGAEGYKIPLDPSLDFSAPITFELHLPTKLQWLRNTQGHSWPENDGINQACWIKSLDLSVNTKNSMNYDLADISYENVIEDESVNDMGEITMKITTYPGNGMHSYSNVGYNGTLLTGLADNGLAGNVQKPEENVIEKYVNQYSTNTLKENLTLDLTVKPLDIVQDCWWEETINQRKFLMVLGQTIDWAEGSQEISLIELKGMQYEPVNEWSLSPTIIPMEAGGGIEYVDTYHYDGNGIQGDNNGNSWIHLTVGDSGSREGRLIVEVDPNPYATERTGTAYVIDASETMYPRRLPFTVAQSGSTTGEWNLEPASVNGALTGSTEIVELYGFDGDFERLEYGCSADGVSIELRYGSGDSFLYITFAPVSNPRLFRAADYPWVRYEGTEHSCAIMQSRV